MFLLSLRVASVLEWSWEVVLNVSGAVVCGPSLALASWIAPLHVLMEALELISCSLLPLRGLLAGPLIIGAVFFMVDVALFLWL